MHTHQDLLVQNLKILFPHETPRINVRKQTQLKYPNNEVHTHNTSTQTQTQTHNNYPLELDVWFPRLKLCFEFQDDYHYTTTWYHQGALQQVQLRDNIKKATAMEAGLLLIAIPFWWDGRMESLRATLEFYCPDYVHMCGLFTSSMPVMMPIALNPVPMLINSNEIPDVGELMYASFPPDALQFNNNNHSAWWLGEKYDGVRCCWNPHRSCLYSRYGYIFTMPSQVISNMPNNFIDAEIWFGRGAYVLTSALFSIAVLVMWNLLRIMAFDSPPSPPSPPPPLLPPLQQDKPFEQRYNILINSHASDHPFIVIAPRLWCTRNYKYLLGSIISDSGEGIILRKEGSHYKHGRSNLLLKMKTLQEDKEGMVTGIKQGAIQLQLANGVQLVVPPSNVQVRNLGVGDIVTFSFDSRVRGEVPSNPIIFRRRVDMEWREIGNIKEASGTSFTSMSQGYWTLPTMRVYMENFARKIHLDPLLASTWYGLSSDDFRGDSDGRIILNKLNGYRNTIHSLFPEIANDSDQFVALEHTYIEHQRAFFIAYAKLYKFDPLHPSNWYQQKTANIMSMPNARKIIPSRNISKALYEAFPEIGLHRDYLFVSPWSKVHNQRKFFENYAARNNFDALIPTNWYRQSSTRFKADKEFKIVFNRILKYYSGSFPNALATCFPEINLNIWHLYNVLNLSDAKKRRNLLENYAQQKGMDPLIPEHWYQLHKQHEILSLPGSKLVLKYHKTISRALLDLFPEIGLKLNKLCH